MALALDIASWACLLVGALLCAAGGVGMIGLAFQAGFTLVTVKLALIGVLLFFTSPTATHALVKSALAGGLKPLARDFEAVRSEDGASDEERP